jgi:hypothetical protein
MRVFLVRYKFNLALRILCAAVALLACLSLFIPSTWFVDLWLALGRVNLAPILLRIFYLGIALGAVWAYQETAHPFKRLLYASIVALIALVLGSDLLALLRPNLAGLLRHPIGTVLTYVTTALVIVAMLIQIAEERASK